MAAPFTGYSQARPKCYKPGCTCKTELNRCIGREALPLIGQLIEADEYDRLRAVLSRGSDCVKGGSTQFHQECEGRLQRLSRVNIIATKLIDKTDGREKY